jgi:hypothetical protein
MPEQVETLLAKVAKQRDAALARIAELEASLGLLRGKCDHWEAEAEKLASKRGKRFPIQWEGTIPWSVAEVAYQAYAKRFGRHQSLERLAQRGGFSAGEMDMFAPDWRERVEKTEGFEARIAELERELNEKLEYIDALLVGSKVVIEERNKAHRLGDAMAQRGDRMATAIDALLRRDVALEPHATAPLRITRDAWRAYRKGTK